MKLNERMYERDEGGWMSWYDSFLGVDDEMNESNESYDG